MRRTFLSLTLVATIVGVLIFPHQSNTEREIMTKYNYHYDFNIEKITSRFPIKEEKIAIKEEKVVKKAEKPTFANISLPEEIQQYIWEKSIESKIDYLLLLSMAEYESNFDTNLVSETDDYGLFQIHGSTGRNIAKDLQIKNYSLFDPKTNIDFAMFYLKYVRDYWLSQNVSEDDIVPLMIISYNRGEVSAKRYVRDHGIEANKYLQNVMKHKGNIEKGRMVS